MYHISRSQAAPQPGRLLPCPSELGLGWDSRLEAGRYIARAYYNNDRFKAMQPGLPNNRGINSLATVGHEMTHAVLLKMYGISRSEEIDGGALSGIVYLDDALLPVSYSRMKYAMQRITDSLPYSANLGAYSMSRSSARSALRCDICSSYLLR